MLERPDRALVAWGDALRHSRVRRRLLVRGGGLAAGCAALLATLVAPPVPLLVWNASASMPIGLYRVAPGTGVSTGDVVIARLPQAVRALAAERHYLPTGLPLVKAVAATAGQLVCWRPCGLSIDGRFAARRLSRDRRGRPLPWRKGCWRLAPGSVLLLAPGAPDSFDGRYFGPTASGDLIGEARPLWLR